MEFPFVAGAFYCFGRFVLLGLIKLKDNLIMHCTYCSKELSDGDMFCDGCGRQQKHLPTVPPQVTSASNGMAVAGFVCSLTEVLCVLGLIFSIVGLVKSLKHPSHPGRGIAIAGIIISAICILAYSFLIIIAVYYSNQSYSYSPYY
jgi:hypothetical protein